MMKHTIDNQEKYSVITVENEKLDTSISSDLKSLFVTLSNENKKNYVLDMKNIKYVDSSGLGAILIGNRLSKDLEGSLVLCNVGEHVMKLINISQLDKVLYISNTLEEALDLIIMNDLENDLRNQSN